MKKYDPDAYGIMCESLDGEYVKWEDVKDMLNELCHYIFKEHIHYEGDQVLNSDFKIDRPYVESLEMEAEIRKYLK